MSSPRSWFVWAADPETLLPRTRVVTALRTALHDGDGDTSTDLATLDEQVRSWADAERDRFTALLQPTGNRTVLVRRIALGCAPLGLHAGGWLQWLTCPANADSATALRVLALYASDIGVGHPHADRGSAYRTLLGALRLAEWAASATRLARDEQLDDQAFALAGPLLLASRFPVEFRSEILGADLCLRAVGLTPPLVAVRQVAPDLADWTALDLGAARDDETPSGLELSRRVVSDLLAESGRATGAADQVRLGFRWAMRALRGWTDALHGELVAVTDPAAEMAELLRLRAREAAVYHGDYPLAGQPLRQWLADSQHNPSALLTALARSRLVRPGEPDRSPLASTLISEGGAMFRVFSPEDITVIRRWISALPDARDQSRGHGTADDGAVADGRPTRSSAAQVDLRLPDPVPEDDDRTPATLREAYHLLLNRRDTPALRRYAIAYLTNWLGRSGYQLEQAVHLPPQRWQPAELRRWLQQQHDRHAEEFDDTKADPLPSREALIDSTIQLAPLTLIDGSWLQGFTDHAYAPSDVGHFLFETYWDELGNGERRLNHPLLYREVLHEMGVDLPPTATPEFSAWSGFRDESFELPVYWLCIGRLPHSYLAEVLGLNLAMELSGVGGSYRRARRALKKYGYSTRFVDIHNTIDNVATGHSAWAADAVDTYMAAAPTMLGGIDRAAVWHRVLTGYRSLNPPKGIRPRLAGRLAARRQTG
ncbi:iron-containing redox enzyme family protein [Micromonospora sp. NPDC048999]|uniref:iron-containing redox enzyme family protein n=1 Tax=Micromonospora sp. NPDC048999 TaxID=3155391 RepID=UPI0033C05E83